MTSWMFSYKRALCSPAFPVAWAALSIFLVVSGPFGTGAALSLGARAVFWPLIVGVGILVGVAIRLYVTRAMGIRAVWRVALNIAGLATLVLSPLAWALQSWLTDAPGAAPQQPALIALYVFVASLTTTALRHAFRVRPKRRAVFVPQPEPPAEPPRLLQRLAPEQHAPILRMQVRDHYVDVVTEAGTHSLLMRFADAISELEEADGLRVHRSHWVSGGAVSGLRRDKGRLRLVTQDGAEVPVSKTYQDDVIARWGDAAE